MAGNKSDTDEKKTEPQEQLRAIRQRFNSDPQTMSVLSFLADRVDREQEIYWLRFYAFATLHAGTFVLATSSALSTRWPIEAVGLLLAFVWLYVQWVSLQYVDRLKPLYHEAREEAGIRFKQPQWLSARRELSSTDVAIAVPIVVAVTWVLTLIFFR